MKNSVIAALVVGCFCIGCGSKPDDQAAATPAGSPATPAPSAAGGSPAPAGSFAAVQQVFTQSCVGCHGGERPKAGINLTSYDSIMKGGGEGPIVKAGDPDGSTLVQALHGVKGAKQMPPKKGPIPADQIKTIEDWIKAGAKNA